MDHQIRCKRIIDGKTYNTETATLLGRWKCEEPREEALFKTRHGAYFLYVFLEIDHPEEWIAPVEPEAAQKWMEQYCRADLIEAEFGEMPEAGDPEARITLRIPETLRKRIAIIAQQRNQSLNAWILRCIERATDVES